MGLLSLLAVPAAAIAGGTTCTAVVRGASLNTVLPAFISGIVWGLALAVGILLAADWLLEKVQHARPAKRSYVAAASRLSLATPQAVVTGIFVGAIVGAVLWRRQVGGAIPLPALAAGISAFAVWSASFWRALRSQRSHRDVSEQD
jgi:hypothetical protein